MPDFSSNLPVGLTGLNLSSVPTNAVNADAHGNLNVVDYATSATGSAVPTNASFIGGKNPSGNLVGFVTDASSNLLVSIATGNPSTDRTGSGSIAALNAAVISITTGCSSVSFTIIGTWAGVLQIEGTVDNTNWVDLDGLILPAGSLQSTMSANGTITVPCGGFQSVRMIATSYSSGTADITWDSSTGVNIVQVVNPTYSNLNVAAYQPTAANFQTTARLNDGSGNAITSTVINSKQRLDINSSAEGVDNTTAPFGTLQIGGMDPTGKLQAFNTVPSGEQFVRDVLNISSQYRAQSVTTTAAQALGGSTILVNRKLITVTPTNGTIYWGTTSAVTTASGSPLFPNNTLFLSCTDNSPIYLIAAATTDVRITEFS